MNLKTAKKNLEKKRREEKRKMENEFIDTFRFISVWCETCKMIAQTKETDFTICNDVAQLTQTALERHREIQNTTKTICVNPKLIISYESVLISDSLLNVKEEKSSLIM